MTIDINELRRLAQAATPGPWKACRNHECYEGTYFEIDPEDEAEYAAKPFTHIKARAGVVTAAHDLFEFDREDAEFIAAANPAAISELLDRLEAAEKDIIMKEEVIDSLAAVVKRLDAQCDVAETEALEQARLNGMGAERELALMAKLEAAECELNAAKQRLTMAAVVHQDLLRSHSKIYQRLSSLADEKAELRAKIEAMEKQVPVCRAEDLAHAQSLLPYLGLKPEDLLYALPGAQPRLNEIKIALQRALELGARETWTGARKHRSREDQREEQQCWNKVWSLLSAQGEEK